MILLQTEKLSKTFGGKTAVNNVDTVFESGKIYGLLGPNGSGKSTFMKMAAGLFYPTNGTITVMNEPLSIKSKAHVAYMPTEQFIYDYMTVKTTGEFFKDFYSDFDSEKYEELISFMQLNNNMKVSSLSSGMGAKLKVAAVMSRKADIYMLDEPLNGIDLVARDKIISAIIQSANDKNTLVISSHLIDYFENLLDEVYFIKNGEIAVRGNAEKIREQNGKSIVELYKEVYQ